MQRLLFPCSRGGSFITPFSRGCDRDSKWLNSKPQVAPLGPEQARIAPFHRSAVLPRFLGSPSHIPPFYFEEMEAENFCDGTNQGTKSRGALQGLALQTQVGPAQLVHCLPLSVTSMLD